MTRRALIRQTDLIRIAEVVAQKGVTFRGRVDRDGAVTFQMTPGADAASGLDDLDARLEAFARR